MGASTGNMLVDKYASLLHIFETASSIGLPIMVHCEDSETINANMDRMRKTYGDDPPVILHPAIRSEEACFESSALAAQLAKTFNSTHQHSSGNPSPWWKHNRRGSGGSPPF